MNTQKLLSVARWEFIEKVRTKAFLVSLLLTPVIMGIFATLPSLLALRGDDNTKIVALYDETNSFSDSVQRILDAKHKLKNGKPNFLLLTIDPQAVSREAFLQSYSPRVFQEEVLGLVLIPKDIAESRTIEYRSENVGNMRDIKAIESAIERTLAERLALKAGITPEVYKSISKPVETTSIKISRSGEAKETNFGETFALVYASVLMLLILVVTTGQMLVRGLVEEKSNRIIEILVSSCSPFELMMGKLLGLSGLGIVQGAVWGGIAIAAMLYFKAPLSMLAHLPITLVFMVLGYVLYASLLLGLGSLTTTEQEAQQVTAYATMLLMLPIVTIISVLQNPNSALVKGLSYVPFFAPSVMTMRIAIQMPAWWELALSITLLVVATIVVVFVSAKIFRVAVLVYGKRPTLPEILGYLREK